MDGSGKCDQGIVGVKVVGWATRLGISHADFWCKTGIVLGPLLARNFGLCIKELEGWHTEGIAQKTFLVVPSIPVAKKEQIVGR